MEFRNCSIIFSMEYQLYRTGSMLPCYSEKPKYINILILTFPAGCYNYTLYIVVKKTTLYILGLCDTDRSQTIIIAIGDQFIFKMNRS